MITMQRLLPKLLIGGAVVAMLGFLGVLWLDAAMSLDGARQETLRQRERATLTKEVMQRCRGSLTRSQLDRVATELAQQGHVVKRTSSSIQIDDLVFQFRDQSLTSVTFIEEAGP